ncbi:MAG: site-2 protease family protein [Candidatus Marinimicrobia bacterium]|nr:site-2 protease family protein [Candidatus Neomarinimicrobiota bacterium]MCH8012273.1 site-2 protease family protein [Candidatus Neomarinimicrobiota bacterium]
MVNLFILIPPILVAITFHEYAHAFVAARFGDPTARMQGRLTLNPLAHLDPVGTLMLFLVHFGWAKPVPVNPAYFSDPKRGMLWVALAGPASNMAIALLSGMLLTTMVSSGFGHSLLSAKIINMVLMSLKINLALAVFNLLPIPPLDGSKVLWGLLPPEYDHITYKLERHGPWILMGLILFGMLTGRSILWAFIGPFVKFFSAIFTFGLVS